MKLLGYPLTYPTVCFIDGGCGARVYAHTNGNGDFVLFEELSPPWPIHSCYLNRFCEPDVIAGPVPGGGVYTNQELALALARQSHAYKEAARNAALGQERPRLRNIVRVEPQGTNKSLRIVGYVQDLVERRLERMIRDAGALGQQMAWKAIGSRHSQVTIVNAEFRSYTAFVDVRQQVLSRGTTVTADLRVVTLIGIGSLFVIDQLEVLPIRYGSIHG